MIGRAAKILSRAFPNMFYATSIALLLAALVIVYLDNQKTAERLIALRLSPPATVPLESFDAERHTGLAGEVTLLAQADLTAPARVTHGGPLSQRPAVAFPLLPAGAEAGPALGFAVFPDAEPDNGTVLWPRYLTDVRGVGKRGPLVELNGTLGAPAGLGEAVRAALSDRALDLVPSPVAVTPWVGSRAAALAEPVRTGARVVLFWLAALCLLAGLGGTWWSRRREAAQEDDRQIMPQMFAVPYFQPLTESAKARDRFPPLPGPEDPRLRPSVARGRRRHLPVPRPVRLSVERSAR
ncbi:hypothetical protein [Tranquillimonas alkanivorans]|uniref:SURF1-like protein n=1 Tax=Tranquillimonas alkanivorans TaxID=441119 RepID=A0A1I5TGD8_9RHOB|nr:hypothetical protein [Tranquillimonas alkanivorans]SFP82085.1 hypothetical protein SAMN04488047_113114 [Tranquillimonas alkanivorans]